MKRAFLTRALRIFPSVALAFTLLVIPTNARAGEPIAFDEYYAAVCQEASRHGITCTPPQAQVGTPITREMLESRLRTLQSLPSNGFDVAVAEEKTVNVSEMPLVRAPMPVHRTYRTSWLIWPHMDMAVAVYLQVDATIDGQYNSVMSIDGCSVYPGGTTLNLRSWTLYSKRTWYDSSRIYADVSGHASFQDDLGIGYEAPVQLSYSWAI